MSFTPFSKMDRRQVTKLFDAWRAGIDERALRFIERVWPDQHSRTVQSVGTVDDVRDALRYLQRHLTLLSRTPEGNLPVWITPGQFGPVAHANTSPDVRSAWLLDEYLSWNALFALQSWPGSELRMFKSPMGKRDSAHNGWEVGRGLEALTLHQMALMATECCWPESERPPSLEVVVTLQARTFGVAATSAEPSLASAAPVPTEEPDEVWGNEAEDEMFEVEVSAVEPGEFHVAFGCLEFVRGNDEGGLRATLVDVMSTVPGVTEVDWEDRELANVRGTGIDGAELLAASVAAVESQAALFEALGDC